MTVKNATVSAKKLAALLKRYGEASPPIMVPATDAAAGIGSAEPAARSAADPITTIVMSMLLWESTTDKAIAAYERLMEGLVDFNDLRVCMPQETVELLGPRYPRALDRCQRLRAVLRNVYLREHAVNLSRLASTSKREIKKYVETLEGIVPYAAARVLLLCYDTHCIPVDDQLRTSLIEAEIADDSMEIPELANWLGLQIKPGEGAASHYALQAWVDSVSVDRKAPKKSPARKPAAKGAKAATGG